MFNRKYWALNERSQMFTNYFKIPFTVISRCMFKYVPLDVTINLYSFLCAPCLSLSPTQHGVKSIFEIGHGFHEHFYFIVFD